MATKINLSEKNVSELTDLLREKREELRTLRFSMAGAKAKDSNSPANIRADIARLMTELHKRARSASAA
ncbi:MAG TPA: 50S ribosomal protein L29 [Candidatus Paceibacterota bacterium]|jgi:ribosomal protein L29